MAYDENVYPDPSKFNPDRFVGEEQQIDPNNFIFGFGRRICPGTPNLNLISTGRKGVKLTWMIGMHLAEASLFVNITNILANFTILKEVGADGKEVEPEIHWTTGLTR
jgi:hypothetical protein